MEKQEYEWVKQTRQILLAQCKELDENDFTKELGFGSQSVRDSLIHIAGCYHAWLGAFVLLQTKSPLLIKEVINNMQISDIQLYFDQADAYVDAVFEQFSDNFDDIIERELVWRPEVGSIRKTPRQLLMHTITHEFHHKGQIVAMLRLLGHVPKHTDIIGLPDKEVGSVASSKE
ncbi:DinB family protein [Priestia megaterium]|uniref:DinB family protein n=1 Tax=Priestia megaterium TaxID=1404 RepID=UPI001B3A12A9|nr:DinB family protein [Priestia megaterium]MBQ4869458.1 DinB family protein [Priestia megaterium]MEB2277485.1 DinB family protein [Bacillus sp. ILBB4]